MERIWMALLLAARSQVLLQKRARLMNTINAEEEEERVRAGGGNNGAGAETRARRALNVFIDNNKRRRLSQLLLLPAAAPVLSSGDEDEDHEDIQCLDHIRAAARHHGTALPCRSCLPRDIRKAAAMQAYLAAWSASSSNDRFLCAADLPTDDVSTEDVVSATEDDEDEDDGRC
jgi:hypothetical protein